MHSSWRAAGRGRALRMPAFSCKSAAKVRKRSPPRALILPGWINFSKLAICTKSETLWSGMLLAFVPPLATGWVLPPAESGNILCMHRSSPWGPPSSCTWCSPSGGICGNTCGRPAGIPGIICESCIGNCELAMRTQVICGQMIIFF